MKDFLLLEEDEVSKECKFATYVKAPNPGEPDLHLVKERVTLKDGTSIPKLKEVYNYERPYYIVKKGYRNYKQPKEWIDKDKCNVFWSTETDYQYKIARSLGKPFFKGHIRELFENPYLFGADIKSTCLIKNDYQMGYPEARSEFSIGVFDTETDVLHDTGEIIMANFSMKEICFTAVQKSFVEGIAIPEEQVNKAMDKYLAEYVLKRNIKHKVVFVDSEIEVLKEVFKVIHEAMPDFLAIWNIKFDINKIIEACNRADYPIELLMSHPSIPHQYKSFSFKEGPAQKVKASGEITPIPPAAQWHVVKCPASFYVIDAMCAYRHTRMGEQEKKSYSLDHILGLELNLSKLKFEEANEYKGLAWHQFMQKNYPIEYIIYNRFDCISMELLDEKVKDCAVILPMFSGTSDFADFKSQPRRKTNALYWFVQEHDHVLGCVSEAIVDELDKKLLGRDDWIITLAPSLVDESGINAIRENPELRASVWCHNGDLDVKFPLNVFNCWKLFRALLTKV